MRVLRTEQEIMKNWKTHDQSVVSICCITYNHEPYIAEALDGFLMQETKFPFDIIVRDDCSTDKTAEIVKEYQKKYPHIIKPIYEKENQFSKGVSLTSVALQKATGKYVALCEGDDYWTDISKIQKQVQYLESNPNFSSSAHESIVIYENKVKKSHLFNHCKSTLSKDDLMRGRIFHTASFIFKKEIIDNNQLPDDILSEDRFLFLLCAIHGPIKFFKDTMCIYRKSDSGISSWITYDQLKKDLNMPNYLLSIDSNFAKFQYLSFVHLTLISYPKRVKLINIIRHYFLFLFFSFSYFPKNIKNVLSFSIKSLPKIVYRNFFV